MLILKVKFCNSFEHVPSQVYFSSWCQERTFYYIVPFITSRQLYEFCSQLDTLRYSYCVNIEMGSSFSRWRFPQLHDVVKSMCFNKIA